MSDIKVISAKDFITKATRIINISGFDDEKIYVWSFVIVPKQKKVCQVGVKSGWKIGKIMV